MAATKNYSIRFDEADLEFALNRTGIKKPYKLVHFLLSEYCKLYRTEKKSVFQVEADAKYEQEKERLPDMKPAFSTEKPLQLRRSVKWYMDYRRNEVDTSEGYKELCEMIDNDPYLSEQEKMLAKNTPITY